MRQLEHDASSKMVDAVGLPERWPPWLTQEDLAYYVEQFRRSGFRGPLNWYRNIARITELTAAGYLARERRGRRNHYTVRTHLPLPDSLARGRKLEDLLAILHPDPAARKSRG